MEKYPVISLTLLSNAYKILYLIKQYNKDSELSNTELHVLVEIFCKGGECSNEALLKLMYCSKSLLSKYIVQLKEREFITDEICEDNKRNKIIKLTSKSDAACLEAKNKITNFNNFIFSDFSEEDYKKILDYSFRFFENISNHPGFSVELKVDWPFALHQMIRIGYLYMNIVERKTKAIDSTVLQYLILLALYQQKREVSYKEVEDLVWNEQSMVSREISKLEKKGFCHIYSNPDDKRIKTAQISSLGNIITETGLYFTRIGQEKGLKGFSPEEAEEFKEYLLKLSEKIHIFTV